MTIIERVYRDVKSGVALEDAIPEGADPKYWGRILAGYTPNKAPKKPRPYRDNGRRKSSKSRMQSVVNRATLTLVERVNRKEIPFDGSAPDSPDEITGRDYYGV